LRRGVPKGVEKVQQVHHGEVAGVAEREELGEDGIPRVIGDRARRHHVKRVAPLEFEVGEDVQQAAGLQLLVGGGEIFMLARLQPAFADEAVERHARGLNGKEQRGAGHGDPAQGGRGEVPER